MVRRVVAGPESDLGSGKRVSAEDGRGLYTFTDCEMSICRSAQLSSYTGIGRQRTVAPSYIGSSDWSRGRATTAPPPDFTKLLDRPTGTTKKQHLVAHSTQPSPVRARSAHSCGSLGLERNKAVFAAVNQRFEKCHDPTNVRWYEGINMRAANVNVSPELHAQPVFRSPDGKPVNNRRQKNTEVAQFEEKVTKVRSKGDRGDFRRENQDFGIESARFGESSSSNPSPSFANRRGANTTREHSHSFWQAHAQRQSVCQSQLSSRGDGGSSKRPETGNANKSKRESALDLYAPVAHTERIPTSSYFSPSKDSKNETASVGRVERQRQHQHQRDIPPQPTSDAVMKTRYTQLLMLVHGKEGDGWLHDKHHKNSKKPFKI